MFMAVPNVHPSINNIIILIFYTLPEKGKNSFSHIYANERLFASNTVTTSLKTKKLHHAVTFIFLKNEHMKE